MKKALLILFFSGLIVGGLLVSNSSVSAAVCGNGTCETGEDSSNCPADCGAATEGVLEGCTITQSGALLSGCTADCNFDANSKCGVCCFLNTLYNVTDWIFVILVGVASLFVIMGAMNLLMSGGDPSKVASGRQHIMYAAIGLIVGLLARAIPAIVRLAVGA